MARGRTGPFGQLTAEVPKIRIDDATKEELERLANEAGLGLSEMIREMLMVRVWGREHVVRLHRQRLAVVAGVPPDEAD
ncbi:CopG family transcriptional regulator [Paraburkholderia silviterrae]